MTPLWQIIFKKEFWEAFRDKRTHFNTIYSPLLLTPVLFALLGVLIQSEMKSAQQETVPVAFVGVQESRTLSDVLKVAKVFKSPDDDRYLVTNVRTQAEAEELIRTKKVRAALVFPSNAEAELMESHQIPVAVLADQGRQTSAQAADRLKSFLDRRAGRLVGLRLQENGLPQLLAKPFAPVEKNIKGGASPGTALVTMILPYMLAIYAIIGGAYLANDTVAGEKERGTLETLLVSPASRRELVTGKFLAVAAVAMIGGMLSVIGFIWPFYVKIPAFAWMVKSGITLTFTGVAAMFLVEIPLAVMGAGILLTVSTYARNQREAQSYLAPVMLVTTSGAMLSLFLKSEAPLFWAAVPITNASLVLKQALEGVWNPAFVLIACVTSLLYAVTAVLFAAHAFQKESILLKA
ncbi:MAG: ABC transporter permease [Fibrella sp.]|nr:ABC transporter permease [Armatimonadota bacterium]